jgi:hypothetical protein
LVISALRQPMRVSVAASRTACSEVASRDYRQHYGSPPELTRCRLLPCDRLSGPGGTTAALPLVRIDQADASHEFASHLLSLSSARRAVLLTCGWMITAADKAAIVQVPADGQ